jgi:hypothetical protein
MQQPPILIEIERKRKVADILRSCLKPHGLDGEVDVNEIHVRQACVIETTGNQGRISRAILDTMFPHEPVPATLYHYTSEAAFAGIVSSGELRLNPIRKRIDEGGELKAFAEKHRLDGYLDTTGGEAFYKELSDDLFYTALTRIPPKDPLLMWGAFAHGKGVRLEFLIQTKAAELRAIHYERNGTTLLGDINEALRAAGEPPFVPWTLSKIGSFYLNSTVSNEDEVRLLMKRHQGAPRVTKNNGLWDFWPIPIGVDNDSCRLDLKSIHVAPAGDRAETLKVLAGSPFVSVPVTGP